MQIYAKITGEKEIIRKMKILSEKCDDKVGDIVRDATIKAEATAKKEVRIKTTRLQKSITHEITHKNKQHEGKIGTNVKYAPYQEFGTSNRNTGQIIMTGKPYLFPGLKAGNALMIKKLNTEIKKIR